MPSTYRIPRATITGAYGRLLEAYARRTWGQVPDNAYVMWHHRKAMNAVFGFERKVAKWDALDPNLQSYAQMASAAVIGCTWCMDFGYFLAHNDGLDEAKVREVPRWRESDLFTPVERDVLEYAEAMSVTPPTVDDALSTRLQEALGVKAVVELTQLVALENMRSRFNSAAGLEAQGFSQVCELPLAVRSHRDGSRDDGPRPSSRRCDRCSSRSPTRCSRSPPTQRTSCRRRGCAGRRWTARPCATSAPTSYGSSPGWRSTGCAPCRGGGSRTSARGCPSPCSPRPTSPTTSSSPRASRPRCSSSCRR